MKQRNLIEHANLCKHGFFLIIQSDCIAEEMLGAFQTRSFLLFQGSAQSISVLFAGCAIAQQEERGHSVPSRRIV